MRIREARPGDIPRLGELLVQVCDVHHRGRPDLFRAGGRKYDDQALETLLDDGSRPILVAVDGEDRVLGYAFCVRQSRRGDGALQDLETLYLDDLCVDEACRGRHVGRALYEGRGGAGPVPGMLQCDAERVELQRGGHGLLRALRPAVPKGGAGANPVSGGIRKRAPGG